MTCFIGIFAEYSDEIHYVSSVPCKRLRYLSTIFEPFGVCKNVNNNMQSEEIALKLSFAEKIIG